MLTALWAPYPVHPLLTVSVAVGTEGQTAGNSEATWPAKAGKYPGFLFRKALPGKPDIASPAHQTDFTKIQKR